MRQTMLVSVSIACSVCGSAGAQQASFVAGNPVSVGPGSGTVVLARIDRDAHLDVLTRHREARRIAVRLGDGKGGFMPAADVVVPFTPGAIAVADVNGDGITDLGVTSSERDVVDVLLGDGRGGFLRAPGSPVIVSGSTFVLDRRLQFLDVNEDGNPDAISSTDGREGQRMPIVLLGDGRGGFRVGETLNVEAEGRQYDVLFGDLTGRGHLDMVVVSRSAGGESVGAGRVTIHRGDGHGGFGARSASVAVPPAAQAATLGDLDGDGTLDLIVRHAGTNLLSVLLGGGGTFAPAEGSPLTLDAEPYSPHLLDVNGDHFADIVVSLVNGRESSNGSQVAVLIGRGRSVDAPAVTNRVGGSAFYLASGDLNEDGKPDIVTSNFDGDALGILLGR